MQMRINAATNVDEKAALDQLLWEVLWKPLNLSRDTRDDFALDGESTEIVAIIDGEIVGGLVANWVSVTEVEIRHIAVLSACQGKSVGRALVEKIIESVKPQDCVSIQTIARNTSQIFFERLGFVAESEILEHPDFAQYGITFRIMRYVLK